jgi:AGZA family xanthine/uracil permease-like MFS transporter
MILCAALTLFGFIHSVTPAGGIYLPWQIANNLVWQIALGYGLIGAALFIHPNTDATA